jgi:hypothetical protein
MLLPVGMTDPNLERPAGFEPASLRWQRRILPLNEGRNSSALDGNQTHLVFIDSEVPLPLSHHGVEPTELLGMKFIARV